jgi:hypothetical protein
MVGYWFLAWVLAVCMRVAALKAGRPVPWFVKIVVYVGGLLFLALIVSWALLLGRTR